MGALERAQALLASADPDKTLPQCKIRAIEIGADALSQVGQIASEYIPSGSLIGFIVDKSEIFRASRSAKDDVLAQLAANFSVRKIVLDDGYQELHASEDVINQAIGEAAGVSAIISLGGGTITDIGKMTSLGIDCPIHIAIQTAASVDGYTDDVSVILKSGVKRTVPSRWPDIVIADTTLIAQAPRLMNTAGFGEIYSMFTAPADWRLAALFGFEKNFHWGPIELLHGVGEGIDEWSIGLKDAEVASIEKLVEALAVRGITTGVAGTTACLSGIEHLFSHMLDMHQGANGKTIGQHGSQVGVGSLAASVLWEIIFENFDDGEIRYRDLPEDQEYENKVKSHFSSLDNDGRLGQECWNDYSKKVAYWRSHENEISAVLQNWSEHSAELKRLILSSDQIARNLTAAGSPVTLAALEPAISGELASWALGGAHLMRNRFVGIDLLEFLGLWTPETLAEVFTRMRQAVEKAEVNA